MRGPRRPDGRGDVAREQPVDRGEREPPPRPWTGGHGNPTVTDLDVRDPADDAARAQRRVGQERAVAARDEISRAPPGAHVHDAVGHQSVAVRDRHHVTHLDGIHVPAANAHRDAGGERRSHARAGRVRDHVALRVPEQRYEGVQTSSLEAAQARAACATASARGRPRRRMRVVVAAANGAFAAPTAEALAQTGELVGILRPAPTLAGRLRRALAPRRGEPDPLGRIARERGIPVAYAGRDDRGAAAVLDRFRPDVLCIVTFPWILGARTVAVPRLAALNVHPSLLPRQRGPNPWFWIYHDGDPEAGVSVHAATERADSGPVWSQERVPLPRGYPIERLHDDVARTSGAAVRRALERIVDETAAPELQDEERATAAPRVARRARMADFSRWDAAQVWHFLHGLFPKYCELLADERGRSIRYAGVGDWRPGHENHAPGTVTAAPGGWTLWCRGGCVDLAASRKGGRQ
jgi:methionyl-tRNA formyltransferase